MYFVSYRDPNLADTIDVFDKTPEYIRSFEADERDMTKYIIGTISEMDTPLTPSQRGLRALGAYFMGITDEDLQRERTQVITATAEDIRALAEPVEAALKQGVLCVVGNEDAIEKERDRFDKVMGAVLGPSCRRFPAGGLRGKEPGMQNNLAQRSWRVKHKIRSA